MKSFISLFLIALMLVMLCGCGSEKPASTAASIPQPTTQQHDPVCVHVYNNADCIMPKTCTLCGITRGNALGHDYLEGICNRCGAIDNTYVPLVDGLWFTESLNESGSQLECISLRFHENGTATISADIYIRLSDVPEDQREKYMLDENNWYDYSGEIYFYSKKSVKNSLDYTIEGNIITCTLTKDDMIAGMMSIERSSGSMLTVTYYEGNFAITFLQVDDVFSNQR